MFGPFAALFCPAYPFELRNMNTGSSLLRYVARCGRRPGAPAGPGRRRRPLPDPAGDDKGAARRPQQQALLLIDSVKNIENTGTLAANNMQIGVSWEAPGVVR